MLADKTDNRRVVQLLTSRGDALSPTKHASCSAELEFQRAAGTPCTAAMAAVSPNIHFTTYKIDQVNRP